ncbi:MAG: hypothetical protein ABGW78_08225 [Pirellulales bacterium]
MSEEHKEEFGEEELSEEELSAIESRKAQFWLMGIVFCGIGGAVGWFLALTVLSHTITKPLAVIAGIGLGACLFNAFYNE